MRTLAFGGICGTRLFLKNKPVSVISRAAAGSSPGSGEDRGSKSINLSFNVKRFGELSVRGVRLCDFSVTPVSPELCPDQDKAHVSFPNHVGLKVAYGESCLSVRKRDRQENVPEKALTTCKIEVPIKYNVDVSVEGESNVSVQDVQNERLMVSSENGNCVISNIQSNGVSVRTAGGNIASLGLLHGNVTMKTQGTGSVSLNKLLCQHLDVGTDDGQVHIKSLYADQSKFITNSGNVLIQNGHGSICVDITRRGDLNIDSLDGGLSAAVNEGNVKLFVCRQDGVDIEVGSGDILLKLSPLLDAHVDLKGTSVTIEDGVQLSDYTRESASDGSIGVSGDLLQDGATRVKPPTIRAHTKSGSVTLQLKNWIDSFKFGKEDEE